MLNARHARMIAVGSGPTPREIIINRFLVTADAKVRDAAISGIQTTRVEVDNRFVSFASGILVDNEYHIIDISRSGQDSIIEFTWMK